jgi:hypothetical protein
MFRKGAKPSEFSDLNLISLVGDYKSFKGWKFVKERILSHPEEVFQKTHSGWSPLQYAFYYHPDYPRDPIPVDVVIKFVELHPQCAQHAIMEACRNPMTLASSLESLLDAVDKTYFDVYAERDFHQLQKNQKLYLQVSYLKIAVQKNIKWKGALEYMWREEVYLHKSTLVDVLKIALRTKMDWHEGLKHLIHDLFYHLQHVDVSDVLFEAVQTEWRCIEGCNYILKQRESLVGNHCAKTNLLQLCLNQEVAPDIKDFQMLVHNCLDVLEDKQNEIVLWKLFHYAACFNHGDLTLIFVLLRNFPSLYPR